MKYAKSVRALVVFSLAALVCFSPWVAANRAIAAGNFLDDEGSVHEGAINALAVAGLTQGCNPSGSNFCPNGLITREQVATFLVRALKLPPAGGDAYGDDNGSMHEDAINRLTSAGIAKGCAAGSFCPLSQLTRGEMAVFLSRAFQLGNASRDVFTDDGLSPFQDHINRLAGASITNGCSPTRFCPNQSVTRGEAASFLARGLGLEIAQAVATNAGSVLIQPGQNVASLVAANPPGTTFVFAAGVHNRVSVIPKAGDQFIGQPGAILDGQNATQYAIYAHDGSNHNVVIKNLTIRNYSTPAEHATVGGGGGVGWRIEGNDISYSGGAGITLASNMVVLNNVIHHNNQIGMLAVGAKNALVEGNEISYNNFRGAFDHNWEAGGTKFLKTTNLVLRNNFVHHNTGPGLWLDTDNIGAVYEGNVVSDNASHGIFHEISYQAVIRNNKVMRNGSAGIWVSGSSDVEVYGNTVVDNARFGIAGNQDITGNGAYGAWMVQNLYVHNNSITQLRGWSGVQQQVGDTSVFTSRNNRFQANTYIVGSNPTPFSWMGSTRTKAEWIAYGHDTSGVWAG